MVVSDLKLRYQDSFLGYLWTLLRPLAIFTILYVVFVKFIRLGAGVPYYAIYLLLGIVWWGFFSETDQPGPVLDRGPRASAAQGQLPALRRGALGGGVGADQLLAQHGGHGARS